MPTTSTDYNLIFGWNVQNSEPSAGAANGPGTTPAGYAQAGNTPAAGVTVGQVGSGNINSAVGSGVGGPAGASPILENPGYADMNPGQMEPQVLTGSTTPAAPATTGAASGVANPSGLAASVTVNVSGAATISVANAGSSSYTTVATPAGAASVAVTVPPAGSIKVTANLSSWTWVLTN